MGTRIEFYAVDISPFEGFLERSLAGALRFAAQSGGQHQVLWFQTDSGRYLASPQDGILLGTGKGYVHLTETQIEASPDLSISCARHLAGAGTAQLGSLLRVLAESSATPWVHQLSSGDYWWWVCSLLEALEASALAPGEAGRIRALLARVLRGAPCAGFDLPAAGAAPTGLPVTPASEDEHWAMGVWSTEEVDDFARYATAMLTRETVFHRPAGMDLQRGIDWDAWVRDMLDRLSGIRRLGYERPAMISFSG